MNKNDWFAVLLGLVASLVYVGYLAVNGKLTQEDIITKINSNKTIKCDDVELSNYGIGKVDEVIYVFAEEFGKMESYKIEECE